MMNRLTVGLLALFFVLTTQSCTAIPRVGDVSNSDKKMGEAKQVKDEQISAKAQEAKEAEPGVDELPPAPDFEFTKGLKLQEYFEKITVQNSKFEEMSLDTLLASKGKKVLVILKPGCIFCESFLAVLTNHPKRNELPVDIFFVQDAVHATPKVFEEKVAINKRAGGSWVYDINNEFYKTFGITSFPRFLVLDKKNKVIEHHPGLIMPEDRATLDGLEFAEVLQKLSHSTVQWLQTF